MTDVASRQHPASRPGAAPPASPPSPPSASRRSLGGSEAPGIWSRWRGADERRDRRHAGRRAAVARGLDRLGRPWHALHGVDLGAGPIDHLLIGPGGLFAISSEHSAADAVWLGPESLLVRGGAYYHLAQSRAHADQAAGALGAALGYPVPATGVVIIVGDPRFEGRSAPDGRVRVTTPRAGLRWLRQQDAGLGTARVADLVATAVAIASSSAPVAIPAPPERHAPARRARSGGRRASPSAAEVSMGDIARAS